VFSRMKSRLPDEVRRMFQAWGSEGGKAAAKRMSPEKRQQRAKKAAEAARKKRMALPAVKRSALTQRAARSRWKSTQAAKKKQV